MMTFAQDAHEFFIATLDLLHRHLIYKTGARGFLSSFLPSLSFVLPSLSFVLPSSLSHLSFFLLLLPRPSILLAVSFLGLPPSPNLLFSFPNYSILLFSPSPSFTSYLLFPRHCPLLLLLHSGLNIHRETAVRRGLSGGGNIPSEIF